MNRSTANTFEGRGGSSKRLIPTEGTKLRTAFDRAIEGKPFRIDDLTSTPSDVMRMLEDYNLIVNGFKGEYRCTGVWSKGRSAPISTIYPVIEAILLTQIVEILRDI